MSIEKKQYLQSGWSLKDLLPAAEGPAVEKTVEELEETVAAIEALRPALSPNMDGEVFAGALKKLEDFSEVGSRLGAYGALWFSEDTGNQAALAFMGRMEQLLAEASNRILFFSLWWKALDDAAAERLMSHAGELQYHLKQQRLFKDHTLSEPEEKVINIKDINGTNALTTIYDMITNKFVFELEVDGEKKELTRDGLSAFVRHPSPEVRESAYKEQFRVYGKEASVLAQIYIHRVRDWGTENLGMRGFCSPISVRNLVNDIPDRVVETLLDVCAEQSGVFHRFFKLKAGLLGIPSGRLRRYDLYAPLKQRADRKIDYGKAVEMTLESLEGFSPVMADHARRVFGEDRVDSEVRYGKRGGAFCYSVVPTMSPWVLLNYTGEPRQVATLAHELGHAVHSLLAAEHSVLTFHSVLPLAETASVFSEMLLMDRLLSEEQDPKVRVDLLAGAVDDMYATVLRQACFVLFERDAHSLITGGKNMDDLNDLYLSNLKRQFGDSVDLSEDFREEWLCIPHIYHTPFYCYAYSFGQLLSLSLYRRYKEEGKSFAPKLLTILSYGGSASPDHILKEAGINMADPGFWRSGFKVIEGMIDELEKGN